MTNYTLIISFLLFCFSIVINLTIINVKMNSLKKKEKKFSDLSSGIDLKIESLQENSKAIDEKMYQSQEQAKITEKSISLKIAELKSKGDELSNLIDVVEHYRSSLGELQIQTKILNDLYISTQEKESYVTNLNSRISNFSQTLDQIILSFETKLKNQNEYYNDYEKTLEQIRRENISDIEQRLTDEKNNLGLLFDKFNNYVEDLDSKIIKADNLVISLDKKQETLKKEFINQINELKSSQILDYSNKLNLISSEKNDSYIKKIEKNNEKKKEEISLAIDSLISNINEYSPKKENSSKDDRYEVIGEEQEIFIE